MNIIHRFLSLQVLKSLHSPCICNSFWKLLICPFVFLLLDYSITPTKINYKDINKKILSKDKGQRESRGWGKEGKEFLSGGCNFFRSDFLPRRRVFTAHRFHFTTDWHRAELNKINFVKQGQEKVRRIFMSVLYWLYGKQFLLLIPSLPTDTEYLTLNIS